MNTPTVHGVQVPSFLTGRGIEEFLVFKVDDLCSRFDKEFFLGLFCTKAQCDSLRDSMKNTVTKLVMHHTQLLTIQILEVETGLCPDYKSKLLSMRACEFFKTPTTTVPNPPEV